MSDNLYDKLSEPFPQEMERVVQKSGTRLTYIPVSEVINRMNRIFGPTGWSHEVLSCQRDATDPDWVVAHVRITTIDKESREKWTMNHHDGYGGARVKRNKQGDIVDLGDEFKGAVSDALKKACQHLGVGLYLARDAEAIEIDEVMHSTQPTPVVVEDDKYDKFMEVRALLTDEQVEQLKSYWKQYSGGRPVPKRSEFTEKELQALTVEALRLHFSGTTIATPNNNESEGE